MFEAGLWVRRIGRPERVGQSTTRRQERAGVWQLRVEFADGLGAWWPEDGIELAPREIVRGEAIKNGEFGRVEDLRRALMFEKLKGDLTDNFYSMGASDTEFYPHQFKPVLRFIESVTGRHLIADEVGLGKTIESLLIWKELEVRAGARRLLIVCPSMLREKWRSEMMKRFRIAATIAKAGDLVQALETAAIDRTQGFALIASYEALRPPKSKSQLPGAPPPRPNARSRLADVLEGLSEGGQPLLDFVVIDEAHYARNPQTANNRLVRALDGAAAHVAFVSATPIQLKTDNLYELLRLVDPDTFGEKYLFERLLRQNEPLIRAQRALLSSSGSPDAASTALAEANMHDPLVQQIIDELNDKSVPLSAERRVSLARAVERISILAPVMTRSRKRDIFENRTVRQAQVLKVSLTEREREVYDTVTDFVLARYDAMFEEDNHIGRLALITRQRQMASSIPGALRRIARSDAGLASDIYEDLGGLTDDPAEIDLGEDEVAPATGEALSPVQAGHALTGLVDSKVKVLREFLAGRLASDPSEKFVLFSFFRDTLTYLEEQLAASPLKCFLLIGGLGSDKDRVLENFRDHKGAAILLSSEVGSEGVDLQFCRTMINYDLPWNPMRVEQRIGRLDRIGQASPKITIVNFVMDETIEDRVLMRLYERIGVFERSIGDTEQILGPDIRKLIDDLYADDLSDEQREERARLNLEAIERRAREIEDLEQQAPNLTAFSDYLTNEIRAGMDLGRFIEPSALGSFLEEYLLEKFPGTVFEMRNPDAPVSELALSPEAKASLSQFLDIARPARRTCLADPGPAIPITTDAKWRGRYRREPELIDATHPLVVWVRDQLRSNASRIYPVSAMTLPLSEAMGIAAGAYVYAVDRFSFEGVRREVKLTFGAMRLDDGVRLSSKDAENLVHLAARHGRTIPSIELDALRSEISAAAENLFEEIAEEMAVNSKAMEAENASMLARRLDAVRAESIRRIGERQVRLANAERSHDPAMQKVIPLRRAELERAKEISNLQIERLNLKRNPSSEMSESVAGVVLVAP